MVAFLKELSWVDLLTLGALAFLVVRGFVLGCSGEVGRLAAIVASVGFGFYGYAPVARLVLSARLFDANPYAGKLVAFVLILVAGIAIWLGVKRALSQGIRLVLAQPFDAIMGGVIGGIKAFVLVSVLCAFGLLNPREEGRTRFQEDSVTAQKLAPLLKRITSPER